MATVSHTVRCYEGGQESYYLGLQLKISQPCFSMNVKNCIVTFTVASNYFLDH